MTDDWPIGLAWLFFASGALMRGGFLYALGRGLRAAPERRSGVRRERPALARAERTVARFGAPAVTLSFLTVGVQSAINTAAGVLRMPLRRFVPALLVGAAIWATIYVTVGLAVLYAVVGRLDPVWAGAAFVAVVGVGALTWLVRRRTRAGESVG